MEGPSSEQTEQILQREPLHGPVGTHHQLAWTMNFNQRQKCVQRRILSAHKERREPWWTQITIQRSNSKALLIWGGRKFLEEKRGKKTLLSVWGDVFKGWGGKKAGGWIFTGLFGVASVSLGNRDETARFLYHHKMEMACFFFFSSSSFLSLNVTLAGHSTDGYYHVFVW